MAKFPNSAILRVSRSFRNNKYWLALISRVFLKLVIFDRFFAKIRSLLIAMVLKCRMAILPSENPRIVKYLRTLVTRGVFYITALFHWCGWKSAVMILLRRCLEGLKNYFHLWRLQKSLVAPPLVIFSVAPLVKTIFLDSPVTAQ
jgi:hypothetical protein